MIDARKPSLHKPCKPIFDSGDLKREFATKAYCYLFLRGLRHELWSNGVCTNAGLRAVCSLRTPRRQVPSQPLDEGLHRMEPLHLYGLRAAHAARRFARLDCVPELSKIQALPRRIAPPHDAVHLGRCQRKAQQRTLRILGSALDRVGHRTAQRTRYRIGLERALVCDGLDHHRSVSQAVPMGQLSLDQSSGQGAYRDRLAWGHSCDAYHHHRKSSRRQSARQFAAAPGLHSGAGPGLCGLCPFVCLGSAPVQLRCKGKRQFEVRDQGLPSLRPQHRDTSRSDGSSC